MGWSQKEPRFLIAVGVFNSVDRVFVGYFVVDLIIQLFFLFSSHLHIFSRLMSEFSGLTFESQRWIFCIDFVILGYNDRLAEGVLCLLSSFEPTGSRLSHFF